VVSFGMAQTAGYPLMIIAKRSPQIVLHERQLLPPVTGAIPEGGIAIEVAIARLRRSCLISGAPDAHGAGWHLPVIVSGAAQ